MFFDDEKDYVSDLESTLDQFLTEEPDFMHKTDLYDPANNKNDEASKETKTIVSQEREALQDQVEEKFKALKIEQELQNLKKTKSKELKDNEILEVVDNKYDQAVTDAEINDSLRELLNKYDSSK